MVRAQNFNLRNFCVLFIFLQLTYQLAEVQRQQKTSEATVRQLRTDLALAQKELGMICLLIFFLLQSKSIF